VSEAEDEASYNVTSAGETTWTPGGYRRNGDKWGSIRGTSTTRGSGSTPLCRSVCARVSGDVWRSFASNKGRTRGIYGTYTAVGERGMQRRLLSPDNRRGVRV